MGAMDAELHCDIVPRTTMNFLLLAENKEYCGSKFHRSIPNFMLQGGKSAKDKGEGSSYWKKPFPDEFDERLKHEGQGVLSMANSGPGTNGRQFFITYKSCPHLNRKHSVFGKVIGGLDVLRRLEEVPTDKETDRPMHTIRIEDIEILENPLKEALEIEKTRILKRKQEKEEAGRSRSTGLVGVGVSNNNNSNSSSTSAARPAPNLEDTANDEPIGIGKYMKSSHMDKPSKKRSAPVDETGLNNDTAPAIKSRLPPPPKKTSFGDFSGW
jgi:peptidyl-prolyl cis-trans isomerase-like protein 2